MRYRIIAESENYYYILHRKNSYDLGSKRTISRLKYIHWQQGKIDDTDYNNIEKIAIFKAEPTKASTVVIEITYKEKDILEQLSKLMQGKHYILERDISIDNYSKALVGRTVGDKSKLKQYKLKRIRLNKAIKQELRITELKGYPFIILKMR